VLRFSAIVPKVRLLRRAGDAEPSSPLHRSVGLVSPEPPPPVKDSDVCFLRGPTFGLTGLRMRSIPLKFKQKQPGKTCVRLKQRAPCGFDALVGAGQRVAGQRGGLEGDGDQLVAEARGKVVQRGEQLAPHQRRRVAARARHQPQRQLVPRRQRQLAVAHRVAQQRACRTELVSRTYLTYDTF